MYLYILYNVYYIIILYPLIPQYFPNNLFCKCIFLEENYCSSHAHPGFCNFRSKCVCYLSPNLLWGVRIPFLQGRVHIHIIWNFLYKRFVFFTIYLFNHLFIISMGPQIFNPLGYNPVMLCLFSCVLMKQDCFGILRVLTENQVMCSDYSLFLVRLHDNHCSQSFIDSDTVSRAFTVMGAGCRVPW